MRTLLAVAARRPLVRDGFDRPDSATTIGNAETGQAWSALAGTWGISTQRAYIAVSAPNSGCVIESGVSDGVIELVNLGSLLSQLIFRATDASNWLLISGQGVGYELYRFQAGAYTLLGSYTTTRAAGDVLRVQLNGSAIAIYINGVLRISVTDTFNQTATKHGIGTAGGTAARADDFIVRAA